jgi:membrane-associated progesterone receptor component
LQGWEERFSEKYLVVGKLVAVGDEEKEWKGRGTWRGGI